MVGQIKISKKWKKRIGSMLLVCGIVMSQFIGNITVFASEDSSDATLVADDSDVTRTYGDFTFTLPSSDSEGNSINESTTYQVTVYLQRTYEGSEVTPSDYEDYGFTTTNNEMDKADRAFRLTSGWVDFLDDGNYYGVYYGTITDLYAGDKVTIKDILLSQLGDSLDWADCMDTTYITLQIESSDATETVTVSENKIELIESGTTLGNDNITVTVGEESGSEEIKQQLTNITFNSVGDDIIFLLSYYNVVSLKDIEATHIVGPIIAQERAYRTGNTYSSGDSDVITDGSYLIASDYSRGVSSYVGILDAIDASPYDSTFKLNYGFETVYTDESGFQWATDFIPPDFYTRATEFYDNSILVGVSQESIDHELRDVIYLYREDPVASFYSPNAEGRVENYSTAGVLQAEQTLTLQNDTYINFDTYWEEVKEASQSLLTTGNFENAEERDVITINANNMTSLTLEAGKSYLIQNANMLQTVDIDFPEDEYGNEIYDFFDNPYPEATIINFDGTTINPTTIDGKLVSQFPETLVNGEVLDALSGDGGEYSEVGNKIVWNLPNVVTDESGSNRLVFSTVSPNVAGHIVAPSAELWNYYESESGVVTWGGGNLNGTAIVADFHSGVMEMHMWAYSGLEEISTSVTIPITKEYTNGNLENQSFDFIINKYVDDSGEDNKDAYLGMSDVVSLPYTATSTSTGEVHIPPIIFDVSSDIEYPKDYVFTIKEVIPEDGEELAGVKYDKTEYIVTITVDKTDSEVGETIYYTLTHVYTITDTSTDTSTDTTKYDEIIFVNEKTDADDASYTFTKVSNTGNTLNGATFILIEEPDGANEGDATEDSEYVPTEEEWSGGTTYTSGASGSGSGENGVITFDELYTDTTYYFKEASAPSGYLVSEGYWKLEVNSVGSVFVTAMDGAADIVDHQIINYSTTPEVIDVTLVKQTDTGKTLEGAVFTVERVLSLSQPTVVEGGYHGEFTSGEEGTLVITNLLYEGVYRITETKAPDGYMIPTDISYWLLDVHSDGSTTVYDSDLYVVDSAGAQTLQEGLTMINISGYVLPATGGIGSLLYYVTGIFCMMGASICYYMVLQKRRRWLRI